MFKDEFILRLVDAIADTLGITSNNCPPERYAAAILAARALLNDSDEGKLKRAIAEAVADVNNALTPLMVNAELDGQEPAPALRRIATTMKSLKEQGR